MKNIIRSSNFYIVITKLLVQIICCISPTIIGIVLSLPKAKEWIINHLPKDVGEFLKIGWIQLLLIFISTMIIPCLIYLLVELRNINGRRSGYDTLLCLMSNIDKVVESKRQRFKNARERNYKSDATIFRNITKPREQITSLCEAFCLMMRYLTNDYSVKSSIMLCVNSEISEILAVCGEDTVKCSVAQLNRSSLAKSALTQGRSQIVKNTKRSNVFNKPKGCKAKSALAVPIYDGDKIMFIICFSSVNLRCFKKKSLGIYEKIIEEISDRVLLEWHLYKLLNHYEQ